MYTCNLHLFIFFKRLRIYANEFKAFVYRVIFSRNAHTPNAVFLVVEI